MIGFAIRMVWRSLTHRARRSAITFAGVAMAVAALVVLAALMEGVSQAMIRNSVAVRVGHVHASWPAGFTPTATPAESSATAESSASATALPTLAQTPDLRTALWRKRREAMLSVAGRRASAAVLGVDPPAERAESVTPQKLINGAYLSGGDQIVLGATLARSLGANVGDTARVELADGATLTLRVVGIYDTGVETLDRSAETPLAALPGPPDELAVYLHDAGSADAAAAALRRAFPGATVATWSQALPELVQLVALNQISMNIVFGLALLILAFGVSSAAFVSVSQRTREFGILQALGVRPWQNVAMMLAEIAVLVAAAAGAGVALGSGVAEALARTGVDLGAWTSANPHFLLSGVVYPQLTLYAVAMPALVAAACVLLAAVAPAWRGATINVVRALRWI